MEPLRRIQTAAADGREFTVIEFASYRGERDTAGDLIRVRNDGTYFETKCGQPVVAGADRWSYLLPRLGLTVFTMLDADTGESSALAAVHPGQ